MLCPLRLALSLFYFSVNKMMLSFQPGGIWIVPDRKLADHIRSVSASEWCVLLLCMCFLSGAEKEMISSQQWLNAF